MLTKPFITIIAFIKIVLFKMDKLRLRHSTFSETDFLTFATCFLNLFTLLYRINLITLLLLALSHFSIIAISFTPKVKEAKFQLSTEIIENSSRIFELTEQQEKYSTLLYSSSFQYCCFYPSGLNFGIIQDFTIILFL